MIETNRILLRQLTLDDADFIFRLVNSPGWIEFIGNRNIGNLAEAKLFIKQIKETPQKDYYPIILKENQLPVGLLSFIKRGHLEFPDFGFAMLPEYTRKGYCFEASSVFLNEFLINHPTILAITKYNNINSIRLLEKLGFHFQKQTENGELLNHYVIGSQ